jgi:Flp pilus assembly protein TadG
MRRTAQREAKSTNGFWRNSHGSVAVETAFVVLPVLALILGSLTIFYDFYVLRALDYLADRVARELIVPGKAPATAAGFQTYLTQLINSNPAFSILSPAKIIADISGGTADLSNALRCGTQGSRPLLLTPNYSPTPGSLGGNLVTMRLLYPSISVSSFFPTVGYSYQIQADNQTSAPQIYLCSLQAVSME